MVSSMPGIDTGAPERTLTSKRVRRHRRSAARRLLDAADLLAQLLVQTGRPALGQVGLAGLGGDDEAWWDR